MASSSLELVLHQSSRDPISLVSELYTPSTRPLSALPESPTYQCAGMSDKCVVSQCVHPSVLGLPARQPQHGHAIIVLVVNYCK